MKYMLVGLLWTFSLTGQEVVPAELSFCALKLRIVVYDNIPLRKSTVVIHDIRSGENRTVIPDVNGRADICDLPTNPQNLMVSSPGYLPVTVEGVSSQFPNDQELVIVMNPRPDSLRMSIPQPDPEPGCSFLVKVLGAAGTTPRSVQVAGSSGFTPLDAFGRFLLRMGGLGRKEVEVRDREGHSGAAAIACNEDGGGSREVVVRLK